MRPRLGLRAAGGIAGPLVFIGSWLVLGQRASGYDPISDPISRLAAVGAPTQVAMTAGFLGYAAATGAYAGALARAVPGPARAALVANAVASVAIAATPLDSSVGGLPHALAAGTAYASLAAVPACAAVVSSRAGHRRLAIASAITSLATATALTASIVSSDRTGLWQRLGLTLGHAWIAASAVAIARRRR
jgi:hypothetical protein